MLYISLRGIELLGKFSSIKKRKGPKIREVWKQSEKFKISTTKDYVVKESHLFKKAVAGRWQK